MSATTVVWIALFVGMSFASTKRPVYGALVYLMTFFANPMFWWWGRGVLTSVSTRWNLLAALVLIVSVGMNWKDRPRFRLDARLTFLVLFYVINAFFVNFALANYPPESNKVFDILWKGCLASTLIMYSIRSRADLELFLFGILVCTGFVGYEVIFAGYGSIEHGRLEGLYFPGAEGSNATAAVMTLGLPIAGYFLINYKNKLWAVFSLLAAPLILDTVLRCNSRGSYLALIAAGIILLGTARGVARRRAFGLCVLGTIAILSLAKNEAIWNRFNSIFVSEEVRDDSAGERILLWKAATRMIADHPLGSGGEAAFTSPLGVEYIKEFRPAFRSVHNGVLDIAAGWGVQGFGLLTLIFAVGLLAIYRGSAHANREQDANGALMGVILLSMLVLQIVASMFTSILDGEWILWINGCAIAYDRIMAEDFDANEPMESEIISVEVLETEQ